jgi:hypothetical protein
MKIPQLSPRWLLREWVRRTFYWRVIGFKVHDIITGKKGEVKDIRGANCQQKRQLWRLQNTSTCENGLSYCICPAIHNAWPISILYVTSVSSDLHPTCYTTGWLEGDWSMSCQLVTIETILVLPLIEWIYDTVLTDSSLYLGSMVVMVLFLGYVLMCMYLYKTQPAVNWW